jgi:molecular chaperone GrpE
MSKTKKGESNPPTAEPQAESSDTLVTEELIVADQIAELTKELGEVKAKSQEYLDGWQRERAEFTNYKKRIDREREQLNQMIAGNILKHYFEVLDDFERALKNKPKEGEGAVWAGGIELIYRKFLSILESEGVQTMAVEGQFFDPNLHEAISQEESPDHESGQVIEVIKNGYVIGDRVLRPALVRVAR